MTSNITPSTIELQHVTKEVLDSLLKHHERFKKISVYSAYTEEPKSNKGIYMNVTSREKFSVGVENYSGSFKCKHMLSNFHDTNVPSHSIEWVWVDDGLYNTEDSGLYLMKIDPSGESLSYDCYKLVKESMDNEYVYNETPPNGVFPLSHTPIDTEHVRVYVNGRSLIRTDYYNIIDDELVFETGKVPPRGLEIDVEYYYLHDSHYDLKIDKNSRAMLKEGVYLYISNSILPNEEHILQLFEENKDSYHTYSSRVDTTLNLMFRLDSKRTESELIGFLESRLDLELRSAYRERNWPLTSISFNEEDREEWEEGGFLTVSNSSIILNVSMEWCRMVPKTKEYSGYYIFNTLLNRKEY